MTSELRDLAVTAAQAAGQLIRDGRHKSLEVAFTKSSEVDIVTEMDLAAESLLIERILEQRPDDGILGEEGGLRPGTSGLTWVLDPIDGTVNYLYGVGPYAVSVAVVEGEPHPQLWSALAGCVYQPGTGDGQDGVTYDACRGQGAQRNGRPVAGPTDVGLRHALVGTGFGYLEARRRRQAAVIAALLPELRDIRRLGSAALDLCLVADGRLDGYFERGLNPWDHAAGALIAQEAGARVSGPGEGAPTVEMTIAAGPRLHRELSLRLRELDAFAD